MKSLFALVALLLAGTIAAFLRNVSLWSVLTATLVFLGMVLTFLLGVYAGYDHANPRHRRRFARQPGVLARSEDQFVRSH
jgi:hypothetical protein